MRARQVVSPGTRMAQAKGRNWAHLGSSSRSASRLGSVEHVDFENQVFADRFSRCKSLANEESASVGYRIGLERRWSAFEGVDGFLVKQGLASHVRISRGDPGATGEEIDFQALGEGY